MAEWKLTLYNNTLSSKSGNVVPCCPTLDTKRAFRNSLQVTVPSESLAIIDKNIFFNTDVQRLTVEFDEDANPLCYRSNYAVVELNIPGGGAIFSYYWIDNIQYMNCIDKTANIAKGASMVAVLELSKDVWQSEFFREEYKKDEGWVLVMPKISKFFIERTTHPTVLNSFPNRAPNPGVDYSLSLPHTDTQLSGTIIRPIVIYSLSTRTTNNPYSSFLVLYGTKTYDISTSAGRRDAINEILILNNPGEVLEIQLPPEYGEVLHWTYIVSVKAYLMPDELIPRMFFYGAPGDYTAKVRYTIGSSKYDRRMGVGSRSITHTKDITFNSPMRNLFPIEVGTLLNRLKITPSIEVLNIGNWGNTLTNFRYKQGKIVVEFSLYGDTIALLLTTQDGATINIAEDFQIPYSLSDEGQRASERAAQAELNTTLSILTTIVSLGATVATGGAAAPLALVTGTAGLVSGVQGAQNAAEQRELATRIPGIKGNAPGRFFSAIKGIYVREYQPSTYYGLNTLSLFDISGSECNIELGDYDIIGLTSAKDVFKKPSFTDPNNSKPYAYIRGQIYATGIAEDYLTEISTKISRGIYFIYF